MMQQWNWQILLSTHFTKLSNCSAHPFAFTDDLSNCTVQWCYILTIERTVLFIVLAWETFGGYNAPHAYAYTTPLHKRGRGFARRSRSCVLGAIACYLVGGRAQAELPRQNSQQPRCPLATEGSATGRRTERALKWERRSALACYYQLRK